MRLLLHQPPDDPTGLTTPLGGGVGDGAGVGDGVDPRTHDGLLALYPPGRHADPTRPWVRMNFVTSVDGAVTVDGRSAGLSGPADRRVFALLREVCDVLVVAAGTLLLEGYGPITLDAARRTRRAALGRAPIPALAVVSGALSVPPEHPSLADAPVRPLVLTTGDSPADRRAALAEVADVIVAGPDPVIGGVDLPAAVAALGARGHTQLLCEGGPELFAALTAADLVDEVCLTVSPLLAGGEPGRISTGPPVPGPRPLRLAHVLEDAGTLLLRYVRDISPDDGNTD